MTEYTPTTEDVRRTYQDFSRDYDAIDGAATSYESYAEEFDRWLDKVKAEAQVEVLREFAAGFVAPVLRLTESAPIPLHAVAGRLRDRADRIAREAGIATEGNKTGEANACPDHKPVQHRDGKPPWCRACGKTATGTTPVSRFEKEAGA